MFKLLGNPNPIFIGWDTFKSINVPNIWYIHVAKLFPQQLLTLTEASFPSIHLNLTVTDAIYIRQGG